MSLLVSLLPILLLIYLMTKRNSMPSQLALPLVAGLTYFSNIFFLKMPPIEVTAAVIDGLLTAWTPIIIIAGAIFLFKTMEKTGALTIINSWLNSITTNKIAQLMIIGWAFTFLIEGASGFGTPAALAAPILVGLGFNPFSAAVFTLVMNSVPVSFGAVGTPTWFGFSELTQISQLEIMEIGFKSALIHGIAALIIPIIGLLFVTNWKTIKKNIVFIYSSIIACVGPYIVVAHYNYEFPALFGGFIGFLLTVIAAQKGWGLEKSDQQLLIKNNFSLRQLIKALFPLWGTLVVLVISRIPSLGIKALITQTHPEWSLVLGKFGIFSISPSLILNLKMILGTNMAWQFKVLYVPGIIPFILIAALTFLIYHSNQQLVGAAIKETAMQMTNPIKALLGALVLVNLLMMGGDKAPTMQIGLALAKWLGWGWNFFAPFLGALGSFFSGSNTVSNLTFGAIQDSIANQLGLNRTTILAAQSVGGALGNMVCINNIVAVCSVLGLSNMEGKLLKKTVIPMSVYGIIAGLLCMII